MFTQLTEFIETLAEKHGYDVETMQDEWWGVQESDDHRCSARLSKKNHLQCFMKATMNGSDMWMCEKHFNDTEVAPGFHINGWGLYAADRADDEEPEKLNEPEEPIKKSKKEKVLCSYIFENGKKKGQTCGTWVRNPDEISCAKHTEKKLYDAKKTQIFTHLVKAFENLSTSRGGTFAELTYDADTGYPIIQYKFPTKAANFLQTVPKEVFEEFAHDQKIAKKEDKIEHSYLSTWCDCHKYN